MSSRTVSPEPSFLISLHNPSKNNTASLCLRFGFLKPVTSDKCDVHKNEQHHREEKNNQKEAFGFSLDFLCLLEEPCLLEVSWYRGWGPGNDAMPSSELAHLSALIYPLQNGNGNLYFSELPLKSDSIKLPILANLWINRVPQAVFLGQSSPSRVATRIIFGFQMGKLRL